MIDLYVDESKCCGCGACLNACPRNAIFMKSNGHGFMYPSIDPDKCISCGICLSVCPMKVDNDLSSPIETYAASIKEYSVIQNSSSGGIFAALALYIIENGGVVFGAAYSEDFHVHHIMIDSIDDLHLVQGSKYVQSDSELIFRKVKQCLMNEQLVLFSGTPCQVSGLKRYLNREYNSLITVDLICHGVPSYQMFYDSLFYLKNMKLPISRIDFRDKVNGWGTEGSVYNFSFRKPYNKLTSSFYYFYLKNSLNRDSCYYCRFATTKRVGDITLGDYWRIESAHPNNIPDWNIKNGISCVMLNSLKGQVLFDKIKFRLTFIKSKYELVSSRNERMNCCKPEPALRKRLLNIYEKKGYSGINDYWKMHVLGEYVIMIFKSMIPDSIKYSIKKKLI